MIDRRLFLLGVAVTAAGCTSAAVAPARYALRGSREQGSLMVGKALMPCLALLDGKPLHNAAATDFTFGIAHDRTDPLHLELRFSDGGTASEDIAPVVRAYEEQRIDGLEEKYVSPPPEIIERIRCENALVAEVRKLDSDRIGFAEPFDWPTKGIVSSVFGSRRILNGEPRAPHFGVDIAAPEGSPIVAPADAAVVLAEADFYLSGGTTILDHGHGVFTAYLHQSALRVAAGDKIVRGQTIGLVGKTGRATGAHLHWGMNWFATRLDPSRWVREAAPPRG